MELLYVWIEKFRNIEKKGFNLSNQYEVSYDSTLNDLTINLIEDDNGLISANGSLNFKSTTDHYLQGFFNIKSANTSANISQITALIGKNSSGKSNIIDFILTIMSKGRRNRITSNYLLIFKKDNELYFWGKTLKDNLTNSSLSSLQIPINKSDPSDEWDTMFYSNVADNKEYLFEGSSVYNCSFDAMNKLQANKINFVNSEIFSDTWKKLSPENDKNKRIRFIFNPIAFLELEKQLNNHEKVSGILKRYRKAIYQESTSNYNRFKYGLAINLFCFLVSKSSNIEDFLKTIKLSGNDNIAEIIINLHKKIVAFLSSYQYSEIEESNDIDFNLYISLLLSLENDKYDFGEIERYSSSILIDFNDSFKDLIEGKQAVFNTPSLISHDWSRLSSGMRAYLNLFSQLYSVSEEIKSTNKSLLLCIDEGDLYLHPEWQKNFLNDLIWFISSVFKSKNVQIILTSHSPFLISDLPKENVILLDDYCTPNRQLNEVSSFGANIHQLFTKQFFLTNGSIGEFAKKKITILLKEIKEMNQENIEQYQQRIDMIGEPVLRFRLDDELKKRLKTLSKETQIKWHQSQISKLSNS
ncbi:AAA family ATPase [Myroides odoratus]|uniref:AAA family ATPase n=1 Tax=Myroides odoratus TaxID=256 RepID=UPI00333E5B24